MKSDFKKQKNKDLHKFEISLQNKKITTTWRIHQLKNKYKNYLCQQKYLLKPFESS